MIQGVSGSRGSAAGAARPPVLAPESSMRSSFTCSRRGSRPSDMRRPAGGAGRGPFSLGLAWRLAQPFRFLGRRQVLAPALPVALDMPARVGPVRAPASSLGEGEHLRQHPEGPVGLMGLVAEAMNAGRRRSSAGPPAPTFPRSRDRRTASPCPPSFRDPPLDRGAGVGRKARRPPPCPVPWFSRTKHEPGGRRPEELVLRRHPVLVRVSTGSKPGSRLTDRRHPWRRIRTRAGLERRAHP